jgi:mono/diheme cytochrome c family protein
MIFLQLFCSIGMTAGYQEFSSRSTSTSCQLLYLGLKICERSWLPDLLKQRQSTCARFCIWGSCLFMLAATSCSRAPEQRGAPLAEEEVSAAREGASIFQSRCFVCHGRSGQGDGPAARGLGATVRDLTNPQWQATTSDDSIRSVIRNGARSIGGNPAMAPNPDLSDGQIQSLVRYIRGFGK